MRARVLSACLIPGAFVLVACGGSATDPTSPLSSREPAPSSFQSPGTAGQDPAPSSDEPPGTTSGGTNGTIPLCMNPPAGAVACEACVGASCGAVLSPAIASCSAFLTCFRNCACTDSTCITNCAGVITSACETAATPLGTCVQQSCASACNDVPLNLGGDAGVSSGSGTSVTIGTPTGGGCSALATCCATLSGEEGTACNDAVQLGNASECSSELTTFNAEGICN